MIINIEDIRLRSNPIQLCVSIPETKTACFAEINWKNIKIFSEHRSFKIIMISIFINWCKVSCKNNVILHAQTYKIIETAKYKSFAYNILCHNIAYIVGYGL